MKTIKTSITNLRGYSSTLWYSLFLSVFFGALHILFTLLVLCPASLMAQNPSDAKGLSTNSPGDCYANNGSLLFHVGNGNVPNSRGIWNCKGQLMPHGVIGKAENSNSLQSGLIVPMLGNSRQYYFFTTDGVDNNGEAGLRYHVIDMDAGNGFGDVVSSGRLLASSTQAFAIIPHTNGIDQWIVAHKSKSDLFVVYRLSVQGINQTAVTKIGIPVEFWASVISTSTDGKKVVYSGLNWTYLFDFDNSTGRLSNPVDLKLPSYSSAFSHSGRFVYLAHTYNHTMYQIDLQSRDRNNKPLPIGATSRNGITSISSGNDGRLYLAKLERSYYMSVINDPDQKGMDCDYREKGLFLANGFQQNTGQVIKPNTQSSNMLLTSK